MMKQHVWFVTMAVLIFFVLPACAPAVQTRAELTAAQADTGVAESPVIAGSRALPQEATCATPSPTARTRCRELEAALLAATVQVEMEVYTPVAGSFSEYVASNMSHATVKDGRYLVTHNHFSLSLADLADGNLRKLSLYQASGELILKDAPFGAFTVTLADPQTLVFDFGDYGGQGLFAYLGMKSAEFCVGGSLVLEPGMEVAQIDWDGATAHVDWVPVAAVHTSEAVPYLELANFVEQGASGGGVFYEGCHIANNWFRVTHRLADTAEVLRQYSVAALNIAGNNTVAQVK